MRNRYRLFRRGNVFWCHDHLTGKHGKQESLHTKDRATATRILNARNEAHRQPLVNREIARAFAKAGDPAAATRTWQFVMDKALTRKQLKRPSTYARWKTA